MAAITLPVFSADQPAARVDAALRESLAACDRARECAVLWFAEVQRRSLYRELGYASLELYATQALGFSANRYWQFKRLADDLDRLPVLREAVAVGDVGWTKAQQVARVATPSTESAWVAKAVATGRRELEREVRQSRQLRRRKLTAGAGQLALVPAAAVVPECTPPVTITLRADGLQLARFEALVEKARKLGTVPRDADRMDLVLAALETMVTGGAAQAAGPATQAAGPATQAAGPAIQVVVHQCPDCAAAHVVTNRGEQPLAPAQVEAIACDSRSRRPGRPNRATIPPSVRATVLTRDRHRCSTPGCGAAHFLEVHHVVPRCAGGSNKADNLVTLCSRCHAFAHEHGHAVAPAPVATACSSAGHVGPA
jgi:5-methylcytosine-specific restriction endonuclease McrA